MLLEELKRAVIKEELVALTGNYKAALILQQFMYWTDKVGRKRYSDWKREESTRKLGENTGLEGGWIYKSSIELSDELMLGVSPTTIRKYIKQLIKQGYIIERENPKLGFDRTKQYRVMLIEIYNDLLDIGYVLQGYKFDELSQHIKKQINLDSA